MGGIGFMGRMGDLGRTGILSLFLFYLFSISLSSFASGPSSLASGPGEFGGNYWMEDSVVVIRKGVRAIPDYAFRDRKDIAEVRFEAPASLLSIGDYAFLGCENLRSISLPASLASLGEGSFRECS
ncbi:MAG: leucine-rich repeat domain-containing protein, partial [Muribaculaceae bacterium]|nr:leucine-rich repeat domain-containing protein [Muribaculaceae bacterium]